MNDITKCYEILGLKPEASLAEVKEAYRDLVKVWHPDRFAHDPKLQSKAQEKLKEINEAYQKVQDFLDNLKAYQQATGTSKNETTGTSDFNRADAKGFSETDAEKYKTSESPRQNEAPIKTTGLWMRYEALSKTKRCCIFFVIAMAFGIPMRFIGTKLGGDAGTRAAIKELARRNDLLLASPDPVIPYGLTPEQEDFLKRLKAPLENSQAATKDLNKSLGSAPQTPAQIEYNILMPENTAKQKSTETTVNLEKQKYLEQGFIDHGGGILSNKFQLTAISSDNSINSRSSVEVINLSSTPTYIYLKIIGENDNSISCRSIDGQIPSMVMRTMRFACPDNLQMPYLKKIYSFKLTPSL